MRDFFHGWRRKAGCVLLVVALVITLSWIRSLRSHESVGFGNCFLWHSCGRIGIVGFVPPFSAIGALWWQSRMLDASDCQFQRDLPQCYISAGILNCPEHVVIAHWLLALPTSILSAYLLLWPLKRKTAKPIQDPT